jgi:hypothetical protein
MTGDRAWVLLPSGQRIDLLSPDPESWTDRDLAISLSRTYRWGGHSSWELPLSVAQHSLLVLAISRQRRPLEPLSIAQSLQELLHDAHEGWLGFDCIQPLKPHLGAPFAAVEERLSTAIAQRYALPPWTSEDYARHKLADRLAAASEAYHCTGWSKSDIRDSLLITLDPLEEDPLPTPAGMRPWEAWPPCLAAALFLAKLQELTRPNSVITELAGVDVVWPVSEASLL